MIEIINSLIGRWIVWMDEPVDQTEVWMDDGFGLIKKFMHAVINEVEKIDGWMNDLLIDEVKILQVEDLSKELKR